MTKKKAARRKASGVEASERQLDKLKLDPANVRTHDERNIDAIAASLERFGQQKPVVVDSKNVVRAGNGTVLAARKLGWTSLRVWVTDLDADEVEAYALADNRTGELAEWDLPALATMLGKMKEAGKDVESLGWAKHELDVLLAADWSPPAPGNLEGFGDEGALIITFDAKQAIGVRESIKRIRATDAVDEKASSAAALVRICEEWGGEEA